jgi:hypothetical protein
MLTDEDLNLSEKSEPEALMRHQSLKKTCMGTSAATGCPLEL